MTMRNQYFKDRKDVGNYGFDEFDYHNCTFIIFIVGMIRTTRFISIGFNS